MAHSGTTPLADIENRLCPGCKRSAVNESGGLVVAFGQSFFHVDCFKCAKCNNQVTADTNLLLLSDGSPICAECSYNCNICQQPILDEAIMTGDDSYHAHCFKCKVCHNRIDELVFAKTSHGIYCMNCHNERMAKIRRHAQRKREKEKAANAANAAASSSRDRDPRDGLADTPLSDRSQNISPSCSLRSKASAPLLRDAPSTHSLHVSLREVTSTPTQDRRSPSPVDRTPTPVNGTQTTVSTPTESQRHSQSQPISLPPSERSQSFVLTVAPPDINHRLPDSPISVNGNPCPPTPTIAYGHRDSPPSAVPLQSAPANLTSGSSHLSPVSVTAGTSLLQRRKSYDDGVRPLNVLLAKNGANQDKKDVADKLPIGGLSVPAQTSRADRRRSINPGLTLQYNNAVPNSAPPDMVRSQTLPVRSDSPVAPSPSKAYFDDSIVPRGSDTNLLRDNASGSTIYHSPSSSPAIPENGHATPESAPTRSASHDPPSASSALRPTAPLRSAPRPIVTLERLPQRSDSLRRVNGTDGVKDHNTNGHSGSARPLRSDGSRSGRSSPLGWNGDRTGMATPALPSHRADVPHGVESGTDTEAESSNGRKSDDDVDAPVDSPPPPPSKPRPTALKLDIDPDISAISQLDGSNESSPVERTSISTFIAPALPPIRFSMSGADFSDFLRSVGGIPSLKSLDEIAQQEEPPLKSPTSIITLIPQDDVGRRRTDTAEASMASASVASANDTEVTDTVPNMTQQFLSRGRTASESRAPSPNLGAPKRERLDSNASLNTSPSTSPSTTRITVTSPTGNSLQPPATNDTHDLVVRSLQEALSDANARGSQQLRFEKVFVETILISLEQRRKEYAELKDRYDGTKRVSEQYIDGLTVAQQEYDRELVTRRNAESEIIRLRVLLSGQIAKLTALTGETSRREARRQLSEELTRDLDRLEKDLSKLKAERDVTLAEVEELCSSKSAPGSVSSGEVSAAQLSRSLTMRLDNIKKQYQHELVPLTQQRETLIREIAELKSAREQFLEETTVLNARNEELAQLSAQYTRRMEAAQPDVPPPMDVPLVKPEPTLREKKSTSFDRGRPTLELSPLVQPSFSTGPNPSTLALVEDRDIKVLRVPKPEVTDSMSTQKHGIFKWPGHRMKDQMLAASDPKGKGNYEHHFQPASALRFTRCDHCGEKLWGTHFRCTTCHINVHSRCVHQVHLACSQQHSRLREDLNGIVQQSPSMFGRDLVDQVRYDLRWGERKVPIIVEKCIDAVETLALDFEGIYRKTGGTSQTKMITQLFDRGDYTAFDLRDTDRFNDISSVTSVLKTYFRSLPVPLLTYDLHEEFMAAIGIKDPALKTKQLQELVTRLPPEYYHTLRLLLLHLHRVREHSDANLMNSRNLGVVFGPTLMWSRDPGSEFSDMAGKALMVEWLVENALTIFQP